MDTLLKIVEHVPEALWLGVAAWAGYELRQWRIFIMAKHGGAPDAKQPKEPPAK